MKIEIRNYTDLDDYRDMLRIFVDGKNEINIGYIEPEDVSLGRDLSFVYSIPDLMKRAFEAGKSDQTLEIVNVECKTLDEFWED